MTQQEQLIRENWKKKTLGVQTAIMWQQKIIIQKFKKLSFIKRKTKPERWTATKYVLFTF